MAASGRHPAARRAFTLTELMVVVAVIALLAMALVPFLGQTLEVLHKTRCLNNLAKIGQALHASHGEGIELPTPETWVDMAKANGSEAMLRCDKDTEEHRAGLAGSLRDVYVLQYNLSSLTDHDISYLVDVLTPRPVPDEQLRAWYPKAGIDTLHKAWRDRGYVPAQLLENQAFVAVGSNTILSCGARITFLGGSIIVETWPYGGGGGSRHWVMRGPGTPRCPLPLHDSPQDDDDEELLHLWSPASGYNQIDPRSPLRLWTCPEASYGMSAMVESSNWRPRQIMVMDANSTVIRVGTDNCDDEWAFSGEPGGTIKPRHMGKVNVVTCDGAVTSWSLRELKEEFDKPAHGRWSAR